MLSNKRGCPRWINVGLDRVSIIPLDWSMDDISEQRLMNEHVGKHAKMHKSEESQTGSTKQEKQAHSRERCVSSTPTPRRCISQVVTSKQALGGTNAATQSKWP